MHERASSRSFSTAFVLAVSLYCWPVSAESLLDIDTPILSVDDTVIDVEELRDKIRDIDQHMDDSELSNVIGFQFVTEQIIPELVEACGQDGAFPRLSGGESLETAERDVLRDCMRAVFSFADERLGFDAPGLYRRFSDDYIEAGIELGYRCGYRTERLFAYFSLSIWLVHVADIEKHPRFQCSEKVSLPNEATEFVIEWEVARISDELLFFFMVFGDWSDVKRYLGYRSVVAENRRREICRYLFEHPYEDETLNNNLSADNSCDDFSFSSSLKPGED